MSEIDSYLDTVCTSMRDESEIAGKVEEIDEDWNAVEEMNVDPTNNPEVGAVARTLQWVLEREIE